MKTMDDSVFITEVQRFCMHDGPGLRTTVFFKGCPLHCRWCHNPETQRTGTEILFAPARCTGCGACAQACPAGAHIFSPTHRFLRERCLACGRCAAACPTHALTAAGTRTSVSEILHTVLRDRPFYGATGGLTVSGGEPTYQRAGLLVLCRSAREAGISTCIETCGCFPADLTGELMPQIDTVLYDIKDTDAERLFQNTGARLSQILFNLQQIDRIGTPIILRCLLIPGVNLNDTHAENLAALCSSLQHVCHIELLAYHAFGISKAEQLGISDPPEYRAPASEEILAFAQQLRSRHLRVKYRGSLL